MLEKGHFIELDNILERINFTKNGDKRQVFVFSATLTLIHEPPSYVYNKKKGEQYYSVLYLHVIFHDHINDYKWLIT